MAIREQRTMRMTPFIEHVNLTVRDPDRASRLMADLFGWRVRWEGPSMMGGRTVHVGDERFYMAFYTHQGEATPDDTFVKGRPFNHVGIVVGDPDEVERRVVAAGLVPFS